MAMDPPRRAGFRLAAGLLAVCLLTGCGEGDDSNGAAETRTDPGCDATYPTTFTPTEGWLAASISVCTTPDGRSAKITNISPYLLTVAPVRGTTVQLPSFGRAETFGDLTSQELARQLNTGTAAVSLPSAWTVVADGVTTAQVNVAFDLNRIAVDWATATLANWAQNRLTTPGQRFAGQVSACAQEAANTWSSSAVAETADLGALLADSLLGTGVACGSLASELARASDTPIEGSTLPGELHASIAAHYKATAWSDLRQLVRNAIRVTLQ